MWQTIMYEMNGWFNFFITSADHTKMVVMVLVSYLLVLAFDMRSPIYVIITLIWAKALWITVGGKNFPSFFWSSSMKELSVLNEIYVFVGQCDMK